MRSVALSGLGLCYAHYQGRRAPLRSALPPQRGCPAGDPGIAPRDLLSAAPRPAMIYFVLVGAI